MIDQVKVLVQGGHGGAGSVSFLRRKGNVKTPPDGGNGGKGGDVYLLASSDQNTLLSFRFRKIFSAPPGGKGDVSNRVGLKGEDLVLKVPVGTEVLWLGRVIVDLNKIGEKVMVARGGKGGRGNTHLKTPEDRLPHWAEPGEEGEVKELTLELKILADVGLIGLPNAGKSTLLSRLTEAKPKIGAYPFTTIEPNLGVMTWKGKTAVLADIPGLIEGASEGKGLGHDFLRHLERTKLLIHLTAGWSEYQLIRSEILKYGKDVGKKTEFVVLSQSDKYEEEDLKIRLKELASHHLKPVAISSLNGAGLEALKNKIIEALPD